MTNGGECCNERRTGKDRCCSGMLCSVCWYLFASVLGQHISHILKSKKNGGHHHPFVHSKKQAGINKTVIV